MCGSSQFIWIMLQGVRHCNSLTSNKKKIVHRRNRINCVVCLRSNPRRNINKTLNKIQCRRYIYEYSKCKRPKAFQTQIFDLQKKKKNENKIADAQLIFIKQTLLPSTCQHQMLFVCSRMLYATNWNRKHNLDTTRGKWQHHDGQSLSSLKFKQFNSIYKRFKWW